MARQPNWSREESLLAFRLYCYTSFGKLNKFNPDIIELAGKIGRTPSAVSMKACNFASLDPLHQARGIVGLQHRSQLDEQIWEEFVAHSEAVAAEAEQAHETFTIDPDAVETADPTPPAGPTEVERTVRTRRVQRFFRQTVLTSYGHRCALTGLAVPELLNASHIIPWSTPGMEDHRADPTNGLCLNALHDRAFDRGLITFDPDYRLVVSPRLESDCDLGKLDEPLTTQVSLDLPERFAPSEQAMAYHRDNIFVGG